MKTRFPLRLWIFTGADENLFQLSRAELAMFKTFCSEASKC